MASLEVSSCGLGAQGVVELLEAMGTSAAAEKVVLSENKISRAADMAANALKMLLKQRPGLVEVDLSECDLSGSDGDAFAEAIGHAKGLQSVDFSGNSFREESGVILKASLLKLYKAGNRVASVKYGRNSVEKLLVMDVMADDFDESEAEGAWLPDALDLSDSKPAAEVLEALANLLQADGCTLNEVTLNNNPMGKPPGLGRLPRGAAQPPPIIASLLKEPAARARLQTLSLHNAQLKDAGAVYIADFIKTAGWMIRDLDLGFNEIGDSGTTALAEAAAAPGNALVRLQLRLNRIRNEGAKKLADALHTDECVLEFLSISSNIVGTGGLRALMEAVPFCKTIATLELDGQKEAVWNEHDFSAGAKKLAGAIRDRSVDLPPLKVNTVAIDGMGHASQILDCGAVQTEYALKHKKSLLSFQDCLDISGALRGPFTPAEFEALVGGFGSVAGQAPSWLAADQMRRRAAYINHLQLSITKDRLDDFLESDADAAVEEIVIGVEKAMKTPNGTAWVLFKDEKSLEKVMKMYHDGRAAIYGSPFIISRAQPQISGDSSEGIDIQGDLAARAAREAARKADDKANVDALQAKVMEKQKNQKAAYGGSDMGVSHANTLGGQNLDGKGYGSKYDPGKPW